MQEDQERKMEEAWKFEQQKMVHDQKMMERMMQQQWEQEQQIYRQQMMEFIKNRDNMWKDAEQKAKAEAILNASKDWVQVICYEEALLKPLDFVLIGLR